MLLPTAGGIKPWEGTWKGWIVPASRYPGKVVHEAKRAKGLNEVELRRVKVGKARVSLKQHLQGLFTVFPLARKKHPQILYRRRHA